MNPTETQTEWLMNDIIKLLRPHHWVKNTFIFLPMFFGRHLNDLACWQASLLAFLFFSLAASAIYCLNDVADKRADAIHPVKRTRPVASGRVSASTALALFATLVAAAVAGSWLLLPSHQGATAVVAIYILLNIAYTCRLKRVAILDVFIVAAGFVLRLVMGGVVCDIWLSPWIVLMVFLLTLFMAFAKRRDDVVLSAKAEKPMRKSVEGYSVPFMDLTLGMLGAITIVCYIIFTVSPDVVERFGNDYIYLTVVFVLWGILRYLQLTLVNNDSGNPTGIILKDRSIQLCILAWIATFGIIIYL